MAIRILDLLGPWVGFLVATGDYGACYSKHTERGVGVGMIQRGERPIENQRVDRRGETDARTCRHKKST